MDNQKICIIGDGLAGLSAATILSQENIKIDLYAGGNKKKNFKKDNRTTAISESSYQFIKQRLNIKNLKIFWPCKEIDLFFEDKNKIKNFLSFKEKKNKLMYIFKNNKLKKDLRKKILKKKNISLIGKKITDLNYENGYILSNKKKKFYDLIILCIGGHSKFYHKITQSRSIKKNYNEIALTTTVRHNSKISKVSQFFLKEGPLAILPFKKNLFSVVWSVSNLFFLKNNKSLKKILNLKVKFLLENPKIQNIDKIESFPINLNLKTKYFKKNILILGDGLHSVHPMAGQGFNLVLRDIEKLSMLMSKTLQLGMLFKNSFLLKNFYEARKPENNILGLGINLTNIFFKDYKYFSFMKKTILNNMSKFKFIKQISQRISDKGIVT
jgi:2-octaprenyl-6-methoxyphenol hydroxylase